MHFIIDLSEKSFDFKNININTDILELKNIKLNFDWKNIVKSKINFTHLKLTNCLIDNCNFFLVLKTIKKLITFEIDHYCFFLDVDENRLPSFEIANIKKYIYNFPSIKDLEVDLELILVDSNKKNFLTNYPNFHKLFKSLEEIEFNNFESFLKERKYFANNGDIYPRSTFYQLERIKSLKNIKFIEDGKNIENSDLLLGKILQLPSSENIKINGDLIKNYKKKYFNEKVFYLDFDLNNINDETISLGTDPTKKFKYKKINWFAIYHNDHEKHNSIIPVDVEHLIIGSSYVFSSGWGDGYNIIETVNENIEKCKKLKSVTLEINDEIINFDKNDEYSRDEFNGQWDVDHVLQLFDWIINHLKKYKNCKIIIKNTSEEEIYELSKILFYWIIYSRSYSKNISFEGFKPYEEIKSYCEDFLKNNVEVLHIIDEKDCKNIFIKKLNNIEIAIDGYNEIRTSCGLEYVEYSEKDIDTSDYAEFFGWVFKYVQNSKSQKFYIIAKKEFLDNLQKNIFDNIKEIYFYKITKDTLYPNFQNIITYPNCINYKNCKKLYLSYGDKADFKIIEKTFPKLEGLHILSGVVTEKEIDIYLNCLI